MRGESEETPRSTRGLAGQALVEGTAFLVLILPILIALIFLTLYIATSSYYHLMLVQVADAGARAAVNERYWLGAERPDYSQTATATKVQTLVSRLWSTLKAPGSVTTNVDMSSPDIVSVTVTARGVPIPSGGFLPPALSLTAVAAEPYNIERPIGVWGIGIFDSRGGMGMTVPTFGAGKAVGGYAPATPGPNSVAIDSWPYWYSNLTSAGPASYKPINGPYSDEGMKTPFNHY